MPSEGPGTAAPRWLAAPAHVGSLMSTRAGGVSAAPWDSLNLGSMCGDDAAAVRENRHHFAEHIGAAPVWLHQVHGTQVLRLHDVLHEPPPRADAAWTDRPGLACAVLVADCLPVLLAAPRGVAAAHAGWRGLAAGVVEAALGALCSGTRCVPGEIAAWLGPCIGPANFEVGAEVLQAFGAEPRSPPPYFVAHRAADGSPRWLADLPGLARERLRRAGVREVSGGDWCTVEDRSRFFSYRRTCCAASTITTSPTSRTASIRWPMPRLSRPS
jgi:YfiH family protein